MTLIEMQRSYIERVDAAAGKVTPTMKGRRFEKSVAAARKALISALIRKGYSEDGAKLIVKDAHDIWKLENTCEGE